MASKKPLTKGRSLQKSSVKRSKTFTGCWTCRSRSVKCGEEKPACRRCRTSGYICEGYGVGLVWPGDKEPKGTQRRAILHLSSSPVLSDQAVTFALEKIDLIQNWSSLSFGLFSVFPISTHMSGNINGSTNDLNTERLHQTDLENPPAGEDYEPLDDSSELFHSQSVCVQSKENKLYHRRNNMVIRNLPDVSKLDQFVWLFDFYSFYIHSRQDRDMIHHWVTSVSGLLTPTPRPDNAFKDIFTPLALSALCAQQDSPAHAALLNSLYALAAFNRSRLSSSGRDDYELGTRYIEKSLRYLSRSLTKSGFEEQLAILATIITLSIVPCFSGESSDWRIHFRGGHTWLRSVNKSSWGGNKKAATLYQLYLSLEAFRPAHRILAGDLEPQKYSLEHPDFTPGMHEANAELNHNLMDWHLDGILGVTKPILEIIHEINHWVYNGITPPPKDLDRLELKLLRSDPSKLRFPSLTKLSEELTRRHACAFYYACHIYFSCSLKLLPSNSVQYLARQSIEHIEAIKVLQADLNVSGLLWPAFITACETEDNDLRHRIIHYFTAHDNLGIANLQIAKDVILNVWRQKEAMNGNGTVLWYNVMAEMGVDILLS